MSKRNFSIAQRYFGIKERYWEEMFRMIEANKPVNMGDGMPDFDAQPQSIMDAMVDVTVNGGYAVNQYTRGTGHPRLVNVLAKLYSILLNQKLDPFKNLLITLGAYEALYCAISGLVDPGDEVIIIEPHYDCYVPMVTIAGGVPVFIALNRCETNNNKTEWKLDFDELESKFSDKTRLIIVNTPQNPIGKVYTQTELEKISELCKKFNVIVVSDEVYEWLTYDNNKHFRIASIPGMFERSITIGSIGKTFSVTGWKCGWAISGDTNIMKGMCRAHSTCLYTGPTNIQEAAARAFELELEKLIDNRICDMYWTQFSQLVSKKRNFTVKMLTSLGLEPIAPEGGYFMVVDCRQLIKKLDLTEFYDKRGQSFAFSKWLSKNGLQAIPLSVFYCEQYKHLAEGLFRFCFIKSDDTLAEAERVLIKLKNNLNHNSLN